ncbi:hypothetical protein S7711_09428 [Stachybotrys chartarum IBT 7711]|uniref:Aspartate aminotransferase n=1 Tax=Stachybotrys chartarum (strain CBS 109288 / IBT 7711) TaxID=1280523 RepID=A0A084AL84_STACB|nr:hypothetical protein S7711_09428 [Stachybotrys chartarum IBT 7711]
MSSLLPGQSSMTRESVTAFSVDLVPQAPPDSHYGLRAACRADPEPNKIDLVIGAYRDDNGRPWILPAVRKAEKILYDDGDRTNEYLPIRGMPEFTSAAQRLILGPNSIAIQEGLACSVQTISGTGALHLGGLFLSKFLPRPTPPIYISSPTWDNHVRVFGNVSLPIRRYPYYLKSSNSIDFDGMMATLAAATRGSIILLQACAHNHTGLDLSGSQWLVVAQTIRSRGLLPFFDCAYQGFASGSLSQDNRAIRLFVEQGIELIIAQSFAKNLGLYGQRVGCFHFVAAPSPEAHGTVARVASQLALLQRSEISTPPIYGARIASIVLESPQLFADWEEDLRTMSGRIIDMRTALRHELEELKTPGYWNHITEQIGMFSFTGLSEEHVAELKSKWHIYMLADGRVSMAGLNWGNIKRFAHAIDDVVRRLQA